MGNSRKKEKRKLEERIKAYESIKTNKNAYRKPGSTNRHKTKG